MKRKAEKHYMLFPDSEPEAKNQPPPSRVADAAKNPDSGILTNTPLEDENPKGTMILLKMPGYETSGTYRNQYTIWGFVLPENSEIEGEIYIWTKDIEKNFKVIRAEKYEDIIKRM